MHQALARQRRLNKITIYQKAFFIIAGRWRSSRNKRLEQILADVEVELAGHGDNDRLGCIHPSDTLSVI